MSRKAQTPEAPEQATAQKETTAQTQTSPEQTSAAPQAPAPEGEGQPQEGQAQTPPEAPEEKKDEGGKPAQPEAEAPVEDIAALAVRHRVAAWEQAALVRMMAWADGKKVTDAAYRAALAKLHGRRLGGGRMA